MDASTPAERKNLAVVERLYDEVFNKRDLAAVDSLFSSELLQHNPLYGTGRDDSERGSTLPFVLEQLLANPQRCRGIALAFGPGLAAEGFHFERAA